MKNFIENLNQKLTIYHKPKTYLTLIKIGLTLVGLKIDGFSFNGFKIKKIGQNITFYHT